MLSLLYSCAVQAALLDVVCCILCTCGALHNDRVPLICATAAFRWGRLVSSAQLGRLSFVCMAAWSNAMYLLSGFFLLQRRRYRRTAVDAALHSRNCYNNNTSINRTYHAVQQLSDSNTTVLKHLYKALAGCHPTETDR